MIRHISEDTLLKLVLGLLDTQAENSARTHLQKCPACRRLMEDVDRTVDQIRDVTPEVTISPPFLPSASLSRYRWLQVAAMLAAGFGLGFLASESFRSPTVNVVRQQIVTKSPVLPAAGFIPCNEVDLSRSLH